MTMGGVPIKPIEEVTVENNNDDTMNNYLIIFSIAVGVIVIGIFGVVLIVKKRKHNME